MSKIVVVGQKTQELNVKIICSNLGYSVEMSYAPNIVRGRGHHTNAQKIASIIAMRLAAFLRPENMGRLQDEERLEQAASASASGGADEVSTIGQADHGVDAGVAEYPASTGP